VRRVLGGAKVGHTGTLDPDATGVLVVCVGQATKISSYLMEGMKEYVGRARLGVTTDTQDASGTVVEERAVRVSPDDVRAAAVKFLGKLEQTPPMYSALKVSGQKLYRLARAGVEVERSARPVEVHAFEIHDIDLPTFGFLLRCSKGTYVRTLLHDLGEELGCGGHLAHLRRSRQGDFLLEDTIPWDDLGSDTAAETIRRQSVSPEAALEFLPAHDVGSSSGALRVGSVLERSGGEISGFVRLVLPTGRVGGVGRVQDRGVRVLYRFPSPESYGRRMRAS
jgi:tRNA pseudouridine55 synthase